MSFNIFSGVKKDNIDIKKFDILSKDKKYILLDVRTKEEYINERIKDSLLINFYSKDFLEQIKLLDKNAGYLIYCRSGNRSRTALDIMNKLGFQNSYNLVGGIVEWKRQGKPTVSGE
jgi:rhodanese-related sulfurtransferase